MLRKRLGCCDFSVEELFRGVSRGQVFAKALSSGKREGDRTRSRKRRKVRILHAGNLLQSFFSFLFLDEMFKWKMLDGFVIFFFFLVWFNRIVGGVCKGMIVGEDRS